MDPNVPCVFPFQHEGRLHYSCTIADSSYENEHWCATKEGFWQLNDNFGTCSPSCPTKRECKVAQALLHENRSCVFPFTYNGDIHYGCTKRGLGKYWCPTQLQWSWNKNELYVEDYIHMGTYGYCNSDCPMEDLDSNSNSIQTIQNATDCSCSEYLDPNGDGKCQNPCRYAKHMLCCYVEQANQCDDATLSPVHFGELSENACKE